MKVTAQTKALRQPTTFYFSTITSLGERLGYYILAFLMTLFLKSSYHFSDTKAFSIFAVFTALSFITPVIGGYLSDNYLGVKRCMVFGLFTELLGFIILSLPFTSYIILTLALSLVLVGTGLFKTGPTNLLGRSYNEKDPRIDSGFTLYYMGINIGAFLASIFGGAHRLWGWHAPFMLSVLGISFAIIWFFCFKHAATNCDVKISHKKLPIRKWLVMFLGTLAFIIFSIYLFKNIFLSHLFFNLTTAALLIYFIYQIFSSPRKEKLAIIVALILMFLGMFFFTLYFQLFTSVAFYIDRCVDHNFFGFKIPTVFFLSLDPVFILILSPLYAILYNALAKHNRDLAITTKFPLGVLLIGLCFFTLYISAFFVMSNARVSSLWIILMFALFAAGELFTSALGVAMITKITPSRLYGIMIGAWYLLAWALGAELSGSMASLTSIPQRLLNTPGMFHIYASGFLKMSILGFGVAIIGFLLAPWLKRITS